MMMETLNKKAYKKLIEEDIEWLKNNTIESSERNHIVSVLNESVDKYYSTHEEEFSGIFELTKKFYFERCVNCNKCPGVCSSEGRNNCEIYKKELNL